MKLWLLNVYSLQITHKELTYQNKQDIITQRTVEKVVENLYFGVSIRIVRQRHTSKKAITSYGFR